MEKIYPVNSYYQTNGLISKEDYLTLYQESITEPEKFWANVAKRIDWYKPFTQTRNVTFNDDVTIEWYKNGKLNISYNCIDRHLSKNANRIAYYFEPDDESIGKAETITYQQLHDEVCKVANILKNMGVKKGDRVTIYLPMIPFAVYSMLACARIGAIHSVIFAGFSPSSITDRVNDCDSQFIITADEGRRGGKIIHLKNNVDEALLNCSLHSKTFNQTHRWSC
ncbi:MAG: AMP-binding protein [Bacteriovoracaceae bacterium]